MQFNKYQYRHPSIIIVSNLEITGASHSWKTGHQDTFYTSHSHKCMNVSKATRNPQQQLMC